MTDKTQSKILPRLVLLGAPNCGKSSLFNALTGGRSKTANYPGVTVEYRKGVCALEDGLEVELLDLPGVYGDCGHSLDERLALDAVRGNIENERAPDGILLIMDATHVSTHLPQLLLAYTYGLPITLVLNMMDMADRDKFEIDMEALRARLKIPVIACIAVRASGRATLLAHMNHWVRAVQADQASPPKSLGLSLKQLQIKARKISTECVSRTLAGASFSRKLDQLVLHPVFGSVIFLALIFTMFQAVYTWSALPMAAIDSVFTYGQGVVRQTVSTGWVQSLLAEGIIAGVGAVLIFLPQILILFAFILILEASGYMARVAFLIDSLMAKAGLNGRAFIPLLSSFACAIPGIMATRTISDERDRLTTILIAPLMTCSARWPVYFLIIGAFIPPRRVVGFSLQGVVAFGLVLIGIIFAFIMAWILRRTLLQGVNSGLLIELPRYKMPILREYLRGLWERAMIFISRAGRIILPTSVLIWFLVGFPAGAGHIRESYAGQIGQALEKLLAPIGFNLEMSIVLIPALAAREVAVSALTTIYAFEHRGMDISIGELIGTDWSFASALAFLAWFVFAPQCLSTLAIIHKETHSWKWPIFTFAYLFALAYVAAGLTYYTVQLFGL